MINGENVKILDNPLYFHRIKNLTPVTYDNNMRPLL